MTQMTIAERADAVARGSGLYKLTMIDAAQHPRPLRWWSLAVLLAILGGYGWTMAIVHRSHGIAVQTLVVPLLFFGALTAAYLVRFAGPRLQPLNGTPLDERERKIRARAGHLSGVTVTIAAIAGCFYMGLAEPFKLWRPQSALEWVYLGLTIEGVAFVLPVFFASWMTPRLPDVDVD